jgi:hypothetical protein
MRLTIKLIRAASRKSWQLAFACMLAGAIPATAADGVKIMETRSITPAPQSSSQDASHRLELQVYAFQGTRWQAGDIVMALWDAMPLLEQCNVSLMAAELRFLDAPRRFHSFSTPVSRELLRGVSVTKPAIFFVEDTHNQPAYESEAIGRQNATTRPELTDTVWVAYGARDLPLVLAHELVHVLSDSGEHSDDPGNLMYTESSSTNTHLSGAQCERLRARGEANGLLKRR